MNRNQIRFHTAICLGILVACVLASSAVQAASHSIYDWHHLLAKLEESTGRDDSSVSIQSKFLAGICYANIGSLKEAFDELQRVATAEAREQIAALVQENRQRLNRNPHDLLAMNIVAYGELVQNHLDESIKWFEKITVEDPNNVWPRNIVALLYGRTQQLDKAMWHLERALAIDPKNEYSHLLLAIGYKEQRQYRAAIFHYLQARNAVAELRKYGVD